MNSYWFLIFWKLDFQCLLGILNTTYQLWIFLVNLMYQKSPAIWNVLCEPIRLCHLWYRISPYLWTTCMHCLYQECLYKRCNNINGKCIFIWIIISSSSLLEYFWLSLNLFNSLLIGTIKCKTERESHGNLQSL